MKGLIPSTYYCDPALLNAEREKLFSRTWNFVGFTFDLLNHNDYISADVAGTPILVQNFEGRLRAFLNVCSHRFSQIRCDPRGNGPLRCPYHGWTYSEEGLPTGIPSRPRFEGMTDEVIRSLALRNYRVEVCGTLVFVALDPTIPSLRKFLDGAWDRTEIMSCSFGELIDRNELNLECNWKIALENTLESYHVALVHPTTFKTLGASGTDFHFEETHSSWHATVSEVIDKKIAKLEAIFQGRLFKVRGYLHQLIFPGLTLATTYGHSFAVQQIVPQGAARTKFISYVFAAKLTADSESTRNMRAMANDSVVRFNRAVFAEDKSICEAVQRGIGNAFGAGQLSDEELRVAHFQRCYSKMMELVSAACP